MSDREPDLVIERMPDWNYGAFLDNEVASCIAIGETEQEALNNGMRELLKRAQQKGEKMPTFEGQPAPVRLLQKITNILNRCVFDQEDSLTYAEGVALVKALPELTGPPAASEERGLREAIGAIETIRAVACGEQQVSHYNGVTLLPGDTGGMQWIFGFATDTLAALQSAPSSPPPDIPLCANHAETWFCERNHLPNPQANCVLCAFTKAAAPSDAGQPTIESDKDKAHE